MFFFSLTFSQEQNPTIIGLWNKTTPLKFPSVASLMLHQSLIEKNRLFGVSKTSYLTRTVFLILEVESLPHTYGHFRPLLNEATQANIHLVVPDVTCKECIMAIMERIVFDDLLALGIKVARAHYDSRYRKR